MKKILITGFNNEQTHRDAYKTKQIGVILCHYGLIRGLEDMGYEVDQRPVLPGEDVSHYDHVIVFMHSPQGFCQRLWDGLWVLSQRPDAILAFDDWQVNDIYKAVIAYGEVLANDADKAFRPYLIDQYHSTKDEKLIRSYTKEYLDAIDLIKSKSNKVLLCGYKGGDLSKYQLDLNMDKIHVFNPNPYHLNRSWENNYGEEASGIDLFMAEPSSPPDISAKTKAWVFSSLVQRRTRKWLNTKDSSWPVNIYGAHKGEFRTVRLTEPQMVRTYEQTWGNLMPGYYHAGSGWWRTRVLQCAVAKSITYCEPEEGKVYGEAYTKYTMTDIENMDVSQLAALAQDQHDCLLDNHPLDKNVMKKELQEVIDA